MSLQRHRDTVPGTSERTRLVAVCRSGKSVAGPDLVLTPADLLTAWE